MRTLLRIAAALLLLVAFAPAQRSVTVGIPVAQFNFVSAVQIQTDWCWAASVQMVLNWYNVPVRQVDVVNRIYGHPVDLAASEAVIAVAMSGTAYDRHNRKVHLHADLLHGTPSTGFLVGELGQRHPVLVTFRSSKTTLHAVVVTSAQYVQGTAGPQLISLTYSDPNPNFQDRHAANAYRIRGDELRRFLRAISSYYKFTVQG